MRTYLGRDGYRVVWVRTGEEALAEFTRHPIRLVVLDIGLPGVDGFEVCRRIRAQSAVPILMLTARDEEVDRVAGLEIGADDYVPKPFSPARARRPREGDPPALRAVAARQPHRARRRDGRHRRPRGDGRRRVGRADGEGVRSPRLLPREPRRRALARPAARSRVGDELPRRHADRGRPRWPAAAQARPADSDQDRPRSRVQGRPAP